MDLLLVEIAELVALVSFGVLYFLHARGESKRSMELVETVLVGLRSKDAHDVADGLGYLHQAKEYAKTLHEKPQKSGAPGTPEVAKDLVIGGDEYVVIGE